jgi:hypothetical protein
MTVLDRKCGKIIEVNRLFASGSKEFLHDIEHLFGLSA